MRNKCLYLLHLSLIVIKVGFIPTNCCTIFILHHVVPNPNAKIENNTPCVYAIGFKRTTMLEYIYNGHSIAYDPISRVRKRDK